MLSKCKVSQSAWRTFCDRLFCMYVGVCMGVTGMVPFVGTGALDPRSQRAFWISWSLNGIAIVINLARTFLRS